MSAMDLSSDLTASLERIVAYEKPVLGIQELAEVCGVSKNAMVMRRQRTPEKVVPPDWALSMGPIWRKETVVTWLQARTIDELRRLYLNEKEPEDERATQNK